MLLVLCLSEAPQSLDAALFVLPTLELVFRPLLPPKLGILLDTLAMPFAMAFLAPSAANLAASAGLAPNGSLIDSIFLAKVPYVLVCTEMSFTIRS